jgi:hypothetical protein
MKPSTLHDPLKDVRPGFAPANTLDLRLPLIVLVTLLLIVIAIRARRTPAFDPEYPARRDMARLLGVVWGGLLVEWARSRFDLATPGFWVASLALLPFVVGAVAFSVRLLRAYREPHPAPAATRSAR